MRRGETWWARLPLPAGERPVIVLTRNDVVDRIGAVVVGLITRTIRGLPTEVRLGAQEGLPEPCVANFDNLLTLPRERLVRLLGACNAEELQEVDAALVKALGIGDHRRD